MNAQKSKRSVAVCDVSIYCLKVSQSLAHKHNPVCCINSAEVVITIFQGKNSWVTFRQTELATTGALANINQSPWILDITWEYLPVNHNLIINYTIYHGIKTAK